MSIARLLIADRVNMVRANHVELNGVSSAQQSGEVRYESCDDYSLFITKQGESLRYNVNS